MNVGKLITIGKRFWGSAFLSWYHSVIFDFKMENPDRVPKQITWGFVANINLNIFNSYLKYGLTLAVLNRII
ncbi:MAG: Hypothetical protein AJITA_00658 [Acetilactobacillus jinshanensis]